MLNLFDDTDGQSDTGSDLFATAIICIILLVTILLAQVGSSNGKIHSADIEGHWLLVFDTSLDARNDQRSQLLNVSGEIASSDTARTGNEVVPYGNFQDIFEFEGRTRELLEVSLTSDTIDTYLQLWDPQGRLIAEDDDSGVQLNSSMSVPLQQDGLYRLIVTSYQTDEVGPYQLLATVLGSVNQSASWNASNSEVTQFSNESVVRLWGGEKRTIPMDRSVALELTRVLGPLGEIQIANARNLDAFDRLCLELTIDSASLDSCDG